MSCILLWQIIEETEELCYIWVSLSVLGLDELVSTSIISLALNASTGFQLVSVSAALRDHLVLSDAYKHSHIQYTVSHEKTLSLDSREDFPIGCSGCVEEHPSKLLWLLEYWWVVASLREQTWSSLLELLRNTGGLLSSVSQSRWCSVLFQWLQDLPVYWGLFFSVSPKNLHMASLKVSLCSRPMPLSTLFYKGQKRVWKMLKIFSSLGCRLQSLGSSCGKVFLLKDYFDAIYKFLT